MTNGRDLPWLQDTNEENVQAAWKASYRDVVILNPANDQPLAAFNLTTFDLGEAENRTALKNLLLSVAELVDEDNDKLSDFWEAEMFNNDYGASPEDNSDGDSAIDFLEYAHGSHANRPASQPGLTTEVLELEGQQYLSLTFRQRLGEAGGLNYAVEFGSELSSWESGAEAVVEMARINPYDGTGTEVVTYRSARPLTALPDRGFLRVRCSLDD
jgi:hypothetical protein